MSLITYLTRIHFADRVLEDALAEEMRNQGIKRPMVVTDPAGETPPIIDHLLDALPPGCDPIRIHQRAKRPSLDAALDAADTFTQEQCDGVIGFGGAAALDLARLTGSVANKDRPVPVIAVPTTLASVGLEPLGLPHRNGGARRSARRRIPAAILCDPTLAEASGRDDAAAAGIDILTHCVEAYLGTTFNPPADGMALEGARRVAAHIERAVEDSADIGARREILAASICAGLAAEKGLGGLEALSRALETETGCQTQHGRFHTALLKPVLGFNAPAVSDRFGMILQALGLPRGADLSEELREIGAKLGLPLRLGEAVADTCGLNDSLLQRAADSAASHVANRTNPRHATARDYLALLQTAM